MDTMLSVLVVIVFLLQLLVSSRSQEIHYKIREHLPRATVIGNLKEDARLAVGEKLRIQPNPFDSFLSGLVSYDELTGYLRTTRALDREAICPDRTSHVDDACVFVVDVRVMSKSLRSLKVYVEVEDVNDNAPKFSDDFVKLIVPESVSVGAKYDLGFVVDPDAGVNARIKLSLSPQLSSFRLLEAELHSGEVLLSLQVREPLDREKVDSYKFEVVAEDGGDPKQVSTMRVEITVEDVNDNAPIFQNGANFSVDVPENVSVGTTLLVLRAVDPDVGENGLIFYKHLDQTDSDADAFNINGMSGEISLLKSLDYESKKQYLLKVIAQDFGRAPLTATATVTINVVDVNEHAPVINVSYFGKEDHGEVYESYSFQPEIAETLIALISVEDRDGTDVNSRVTCSVGDDRFYLEKTVLETTLLLKTKYLFDRERESWISFKLVCEDGAVFPMRTEKIVRVQILDVNDNQPVFEDPKNRIEIYENSKTGAEILRFTATDADEGANATIEFEMVGDGHLTINSTTGILSVAIPFDRESKKDHSYNVVARDRGTPFRLSTSTRLTVSVVDLNDEIPKFLNASYTFAVSENQPLGSLVGVVEAQDADEFLEFKNFTYSIEGHSSEHFGVNSHTGSIFTKSVLDRETTQRHIFLVCARSVLNESAFSCADVTVHVEDVNDNAPTFLHPRGCTPGFLASLQGPGEKFSVSRYSSKGHVITTLSAEDRDELPSTSTPHREQNIFFRLSGKPFDNIDQFFHLNESTGQLTVYGDLRKLEIDGVLLGVEVYEADNNKHQSECKLLLNLTNDYLNDAEEPRGLTELMMGDRFSFVLVAIVAGSAIVCLLVMVILALVLCRKRKERIRNKVKGQPIRPDLIQYNDSPDGFSISEVASSVLSERHLSLSPLSYRTIPKLTTFSRDDTTTTTNNNIIHNDRSNIISLLSQKRSLPSSGSSSGCSSAKEEAISLMSGTTKGALPPYSDTVPSLHSSVNHLINKTRSTAPISKPSRDRGPVFLHPQNTPKSELGSHPNCRNAQLLLLSDSRERDASVESLQLGKYISYTDLY